MCLPHIFCLLVTPTTPITHPQPPFHSVPPHHCPFRSVAYLLPPRERQPPTSPFYGLPFPPGLGVVADRFVCLCFQRREHAHTPSGCGKPRDINLLCFLWPLPLRLPPPPHCLAFPCLILAPFCCCATLYHVRPRFCPFHCQYHGISHAACQVGNIGLHTCRDGLPQRRTCRMLVEDALLASYTHTLTGARHYITGLCPGSSIFYLLTSTYHPHRAWSARMAPIAHIINVSMNSVFCVGFGLSFFSATKCKVCAVDNSPLLLVDRQTELCGSVPTSWLVLVTWMVVLPLTTFSLSTNDWISCSKLFSRFARTSLRRGVYPPSFVSLGALYSGLILH